MKRTPVEAIIIAILLVGGLSVATHAQQEHVGDSRLTVPWNEFKELINLGENDFVIPLETFQKLLAQTGARTTPSHFLKDGNVVITREEFKRLVDQMKPPLTPDATPPFDYLITKAVYSGQMKTNSTAFTAVFNVHVLKKDAYVRVPVLPRQVALAGIDVDGRPALVVVEDGFHSIVLPQSGEYEVAATYSVKSSLDKGPHKIDLAIRQTPITLLTLEMPIDDIDVEVSPAQQVLTGRRGDKTVVSAVIGEGNAVSVRWRKKVAVAEKAPTKLYAESHHLISIQDDALKTSTTINYSILHSEVDAVRLAIPDDMNVLTVAGADIGEWQETTQNGRRILVIPFTYGKKGAARLTVTTEATFSESGLANAFSGIQALDAVRETGFIGVELATSAEVIATENDGLEKVVVQKLPRPLVDRSARPLIMGFKYLKHPYSLVFDIKRHEKIAVPVATINNASVVTLFTEDGKIVHRVVYHVRNSAKQFLEIQVPGQADVWSVFVGNQPVEPSMNGKGKLLVPLIRSRSVDNRLDTFPVEVIYCMVQDKFAPFGLQESTLPAVDLLISQLLWSVYLPNDYSYLYFESSLEKEEIIRGVNVLTNARRQYDEDKMKELRLDNARGGADRKVFKGDDYQSYFRNVPLEQSQISQQLDAELEFAGRLEGLANNEPQAIAGGVSTGVLPIQIKVPTSGQVYRFARTIVRPEDPLAFRVTYTRMWVIGALKWLAIGFIALIGYWNRKRLSKIGRWTAAQLLAIARWIKRNEHAIKRYAQSGAAPIVLIGLVALLWRVSGYLAFLCFVLFSVSLTYHAMRLWHKRRQIKATAKEGA